VEIEPNEADWSLARDVHRRFSEEPGAGHIATDFALAHLGAVLNQARPLHVLEFGAGIGTITHFLLNHPIRVARVVATEENAFCIDQLAKNIGDGYAGRYELVTDPSRLDFNDIHYDLVVVDGLLAIEQYKALTLGTICFVEGSRTPTRRAINEALAVQNLTCLFVNFNRGTRYFHFSMDEDPATGRRRPKFKLRKVLKGCWIGKVVPLA
jgi:SAM-dependent methyltransferase